MMIGTWTGKDADGDKWRVTCKGQDFYEVQRKSQYDEKWLGGLCGNAQWLGLKNVDIEKARNA